MMMKRLLAAHDKYKAAMRDAESQADREFWRRHLEQVKEGMAENGRQVRGESGSHA